MAHLVQTMAYAGEVPWHGLGNSVTKGATIEVWLDQSGLTWTVETCDIAARIGDINGDDRRSWKPADGYRGVFRSDTGELFHIATERYKPVQPREVVEFFRGMAESHGLEIETCGALKGGAIVWSLATNGREITIGGKDRIKPYLLLSTSMDGSRATQARWTSVRVVCNNTLQMSFSADRKADVSVRHSTVFDANAVKDQLGLLSDAADEFETNVNILASKRLSKAQLETKLIDWFGQAKDKDEPIARDNLTTQSANTMNDVMRSIVTSPGQDMDSARGTAWGVLNGVTNYIDYGARARNADNRLHSAWFGRGAALKAQVANDLLTMETYSDGPQVEPGESAFQALLRQQFRPSKAA